MNTNHEKDGSALSFLYNTTVGRLMLKPLTARGLSKLIGRFMDSPLSRPLIQPFARRNHIPMGDYLGAPYRCFNDFFCRPIRPELRPIGRAPDALIAPCDGLLTAYPIRGKTVVPVKQSRYTIDDLLGRDPAAARFEGGWCLVFRLCVNHYHRYCYVDDGVKGENVFITGVLHTVRPVALRADPVFVQNCREVTLMDTDHLGTVAQIEVGAMLVGRIANNDGPGRVERGAEKGRFLYGGSTIILLLEKDRAALDQIIVDNSNRGQETPVQMGQAIGKTEGRQTT